MRTAEQSNNRMNCKDAAASTAAFSHGTASQAAAQAHLKRGRLTSNTPRERLRRLLYQIGEVLLLGVLYLIWVSVTGLGLPCPIRLLTGYQCPGCGITRYAVCMVHGNVQGAFEANQLVFVLMPFLLLYGLYRAILYVRHGAKGYHLWETITFTLALIAAIVFAVWRNM